MRHTPMVGTVLSIAPTSGRVRFTTDREEWTLPLVGWAVVVSWIGNPSAFESEEYETDLDAVVLDEGPMTLREYLSHRSPGVRTAIEPSS